MRHLLHRHRELCERAVDPLEIAAGLEAHGVTDRAAGRFRHRDVFSLAEELFARVPRDGGGQVGGSAAVPGGRAGHSCGTGARPGAVARVLLALLWVVPGVLSVAAVTVLLPGGAGAGHGPLGARAAAVGTGLACALVPAVWWARWFAVRAGRRLGFSRSLAEFASGARLSLTAALLLFAATAAGLQYAAGFASRAFAAPAGGRGGAPPGGVLPGEAMPVVTALGVLLFAALLLALHGLRGAASAGLLAACALQAAAGAAGRFAGAEVPAVSLAAAACGCAALFLLARAYRLLAGASVHRPPDAPGERWPPGGAGARSRARAGCEPCASRERGAPYEGPADRPGHACHDGLTAGECGTAPHGAPPHGTAP